MTLALLALLVVLLAASSFFSGSETALFSLDRLSLRTLEQRGDPRSRRVISLLGRPAHLLSTLLLGNTLVNVAGSAAAATLFAMLVEHGGLWWALVVETAAILLLGEIEGASLREYRSDLRRHCRRGWARRLRGSPGSRAHGSADAPAHHEP